MHFDPTLFIFFAAFSLLGIVSIVALIHTTKKLPARRRRMRRPLAKRIFSLGRTFRVSRAESWPRSAPWEKTGWIRPELPIEKGKVGKASRHSVISRANQPSWRHDSIPEMVPPPEPRYL